MEISDRSIRLAILAVLSHFEQDGYAGGARELALGYLQGSFACVVDFERVQAQLDHLMRIGAILDKPYRIA